MIVYLLVRRVLGLAVLVFRTDLASSQSLLGQPGQAVVGHRAPAAVNGEAVSPVGELGQSVTAAEPRYCFRVDLVMASGTV